MSSRVSDTGLIARPRALPGLFVVVALFALLIGPIVVQERVGGMRSDVELFVDPADDMVAEVQYLLARQNSLLRGFLITRDPSYLGQYRLLAAQEQAIYPQLAAFGDELTPEIAAEIAELALLSRQWHQRLAASNIERVVPASESESLVLEQELYRSTLDAAAATMAAIRQHGRDRQSTIGRVERGVRFMYLILLGVAAAATFAVVRLNTRIRDLADEANARRREAERAMREGERAVAARADLIRGFTHDVKNPLGVADGYAELLQMGLRGEISTEQSETLGRIRSSIHGAVEIINELLDLSRLEGGGLQLSREPTDIRRLVQEMVQHQSNSASNAGLELHFEENGKTQALFTDADRVRQILQNLVSNAIKYTPPPGRVRVLVDRPHNDSGSWVRVCVADTGPGIPEEEQDRIFDEFHRIPGSRGTGHGLGLAISRRIARLLGGDVTLNSVYGEGSTFMLWLPVRDKSGDSIPPVA